MCSDFCLFQECAYYNIESSIQTILSAWWCGTVCSKNFTLSNWWSAQMHDPEILYPFLRNSHRKCIPFQLKRKTFVYVTSTCSDCQQTGRLLLMRSPAVAALHLVIYHLHISKWEEVRSDRGNHSFKGGISPSRASTLKYSNSYLINGCLLWHYNSVHWGL